MECTGSTRRLSFFILFVAIVVLAPVTRAQSLTAAGEILVTIPTNLKVPGTLRPLLEEVMRRSPTFRHQMQELRSAPHVKMAISYGDVSSWHVLRAESTVSRYEWGALQIDTRLYTIRDVIEVVAHEMEHVCEQIEGIDVRALSRQRNTGVYTVGHHFETRRAVLIGHQVAREALGLAVGFSPTHPTE
jgi:hypothetical protein